MVPEKKGGLITHSISNVTAGSLPVDTLRERDANNFHPKDTFFFFCYRNESHEKGSLGAALCASYVFRCGFRCEAEWSDAWGT